MPTRFLGFSVLFCGLISFASAKEAKINSREISPGITYLHKSVSEVPWSIHVLRIERNHPELKFVTTLPGGEFIGLTRLSDQVKYIPGEAGIPIGGINGDFFHWQLGPYQGDPSGLHVMDGEVTSAPMPFKQNVRDASALWITDTGDLRISFVSSEFQITWPDKSTIGFGVNEDRFATNVVLYNHCAGLSTRTRNGTEIVLDTKSISKIALGQDYHFKIKEIRGPNTLLASNTVVLSIGPAVSLPPLKVGNTLTISTRTAPNLPGTTIAVGGGPLLLQNGKIPKMPEEIRQPRAALGCNDTHVFFVVVDGRRPGISDGMTYKELAQEMKSWKCAEAMNIDGGGSAMLWADGSILNQPSENRERPNANSLFVVRREDGKAISENK